MKGSLLCGVQLHTSVGIPISKGIAAADKPLSKGAQKKKIKSRAESHEAVSKPRLRSNIERH